MRPSWRAGGEFLSDRSLLADEATQVLRGAHVLPSHSTLFRFLAGADLGRVQKAAAVNRAVLARAWALGAAPPSGLLTIDPDATWVNTYGPTKQGSAFSYKHEVGASPMIGVCGQTGDVLAVRARGGAGQAARVIRHGRRVHLRLGARLHPHRRVHRGPHPHPTPPRR